MTTVPRPAANLTPLYIAGDSHALAPSWRVVQWRGESRLPVPRLVTGLKVWHLREASDFFPKVHLGDLLNVISAADLGDSLLTISAIIAHDLGYFCA